ncbi:MAG TPA: spermidine synthase, partial [Candidatus Dormibacteraeota bacterium]|nr:spermidine synthase [Candidatus Dormibacteraeota bacterium]
NSVWAAALILSSFMAGLALGNAIAAASRIRRWRPLHLYALLEVLVALLGCTIVFGLPALGGLLRPVWQMLWNYQPTLLGLRFIVSFLILLLPTTAMGLTLPVLIEDPMLRETNFGRAIGFLYGSNTLGAVVGAVLGEGYLIAAFGLQGTSLAAGLASCIAAGAALLIAKYKGETNAHLFERTFPLRLDVRYRPPWRMLLVSFGTGCILLALEVIWFRFLRLYVASSSTAFAVMLAVVLAGIGLGGIAAGAIHRRVAPVNQLLPVMLLVAAITTLLSYLFFPAEVIQTGTSAFNVTWRQVGLLSLALMFPAAFLSGILFPSIVACVQANVENRMNSAAVTTLFNTAGAAAGPLIASFILLPGIGYQWSLILCAAGYVLLGIFVSERSSWSIRRLIGLVNIALCAGVILLLAVFPYRRAETHFAHARRFLGHLIQKVEGPSDTYQLLRYDLFGEPYYYQLVTSGFSMSGTSPQSQRYMRLFAYLPLAFRPESRDVLLICYGCGVTADAFVHESSLKQIDIVDISKEVFALADSYSGINYSNPLRDPRVHAVVQDGRFFLEASPRQYDIISGEPPPPKVAGSVNLYTQEFFSLMKGRLTEGGIATFWLPINQLKVDEAKAILRAFHNVFANASVWASADEQWIMMGIKGQGRAMKQEEIGRLWSDPTTNTDLNRIGIEVPQQLGALFLMDGEEINRVTRDVAPLTDFYPKRLSDAPWDKQASERFALTYMDAPSAIHRFLESPLIGRIWPDRQDESLKSCFVFRQTRYRCGTVERCNALAELDIYLRHFPLQTPVLEVLGSDEFRLAIAERVARKSETPLAEIIPDLIAGALARRNIDEAIRLLESENARGRFGLNDTFLLAYLYCLNGSVQKAETLAANNAALIKRNWFVDWLWEKLETDFGFHPPPE